MRHITITLLALFAVDAFGHGSVSEYVADATTRALRKFQLEEPEEIAHRFASVVAEPEGEDAIVKVTLKEIRYRCKETHTPTGQPVVRCEKL